MLGTPEYRRYICALYKRILHEGKSFFDDRARTFIVQRARKIFHEYKTCTDEARIRNKLLEARKRLHRLEKANDGERRSVLKVLEAAYGRSGKVRHVLQHPYLHRNVPANVFPAPLIPHIPHTAPPPPLCVPLRALVKDDLGKALEPTLPEPAFKPLHRGRKANLLWRWRSMLVRRMQIPLPMEIVCELERKAGANPDHPLHASQRQAGGPQWSDFYAGHERDPDLLHLFPEQRLEKRTRLSRPPPLGPSPFQAPPSPYTTLSMIHLLDPTYQPPKAPTLPKKSSERWFRRLYRRLLMNVPYLSPIPQANKLWDESISYTVSHSRWIPNEITCILSDDDDAIPDEATLTSMTPDRRKNKADSC